MKAVAVVLVAASLASALAVPHPLPVKRASLIVRQNAEGNVSAAVLSPEEQADVNEQAQAIDASDILDNLNANGVNDNDDDDDVANIDDVLDDLCLDQNVNDLLDGVNADVNPDEVDDILEQLAGLNLNDLDEDDLDNLDLFGGIEALIAAMGLDNVFDVDIFNDFAVNQQLELFLLLQQLNQLMAFGFINQFDVLNLLQQGLLFNQFNLGFIKRSVDEWNEGYARKVRRDHVKRQNCVAAGVPADAAAPAPAAAAPAPADVVAPEDVVVPAGEDEGEERDLSDFTK